MRDGRQEVVLQAIQLGHAFYGPALLLEAVGVLQGHAGLRSQHLEGLHVLQRRGPLVSGPHDHHGLRPVLNEDGDSDHRPEPEPIQRLAVFGVSFVGGDHQSLALLEHGPVDAARQAARPLCALLRGSSWENDLPPGALVAGHEDPRTLVSEADYGVDHRAEGAPRIPRAHVAGRRRDGRGQRPPPLRLEVGATIGRTLLAQLAREVIGDEGEDDQRYQRQELRSG